MRFDCFVLLSAVIVISSSDIPIALEYSVQGPLVAGVGNRRFIVDTTRVQSAVFPPGPIAIQPSPEFDPLVIEELLEYPLEPINVLSEPEDRLAVGMGSDFGHTVGSMMLLPSPLRMIIRPSNPLAQCYEGTMGYAQGSGLGDLSLGIFTLKVAITVLGTHESVLNFANVANEEIDGSYHSYYLDTTLEVDKIPESVMFEWELALEQRGVDVVFPSAVSQANVFYTEYTFSRSDCQRTRHLFPSLMYTVAVGAETDDTGIAARIILDPEDYIASDPVTGVCSVQFVPEGSHRALNTYTLGMNFIKRAAFHFDYNNSKIGICEPL